MDGANARSMVTAGYGILIGVAIIAFLAILDLLTY